jgi:GTP:adenosylcobinamide-phosphate guanylyltransferase
VNKTKCHQILSQAVAVVPPTVQGYIKDLAFAVDYPNVAKASVTVAALQHLKSHCSIDEFVAAYTDSTLANRSEDGDPVTVVVQ